MGSMRASILKRPSQNIRLNYLGNAVDIEGDLMVGRFPDDGEDGSSGYRREGPDAPVRKAGVDVEIAVRNRVVHVPTAQTNTHTKKQTQKTNAIFLPQKTKLKKRTRISYHAIANRGNLIS